MKSDIFVIVFTDTPDLSSKHRLSILLCTPIFSVPTDFEVHITHEKKDAKQRNREENVTCPQSN